MDDLVWNKAVKDTAGLRAYYNKNKSKYTQEKQLDATVYDVINDGILDSLMMYLKEKKSDIEIERDLNKSNALNIQIKHKKWEKGDNEIIDSIDWKTGEQKVKKNNRTYYVVVNEVLPKREKKFSEARGQVISDYQDVLEKEWIAELRKKYPVTTYPNEVQQLAK